MSIATILRQKAPGVVAVAPDDTIASVAAVLAERRVGAVLVLDPSGAVLGILSERDIVRSLPVHGARTLEMTAAQLMTRVVHTITPETQVTKAMEIMTSGRVRHLPVLENARVVGVVSIGDVVKEKLEQQAQEVDALRDYVAGQG